MKKHSTQHLHPLLVIFLIFSMNSMAADMVRDSVFSGLDTITDKPLPYAEEMAQYPGGTSSMVEFLSKNIRYPEEASKKGISGKVYVQFVVDKEGNIHQPKVLKGIGGGCDEEAVRLVNMFPKWIPAKQNGKIVSVFYTLPINFQEEVLTFVEQMPEFPGGMDALIKFLRDSIRYPEKDTIGREVVQFVVQTNGKISNIEIMRSMGPEYDKESVRLVKSFPDWIPGKQNGHLCAVYFTLPIFFSKEDRNFKAGSFKNDGIITTECYFPGGMDSLSLFVSNHMQYPKDAEEKGIKGVVRVEFKIDKEGKVIKPHIIHKLFPSLDNEAIRIVNMMPDWIPATRNHKPIISFYDLEFSFGIEPKVPVQNRNFFQSYIHSLIKRDSTLNSYTTNLSDTTVKTESGEEPLTFVEQMPEFPGGMEAMQRYLASNIRYPAEATINGITGRVIAQFIVTKTGTVEHIKIIRAIGGGCDEEAIRVITNMPKWKPGFKDGKPVPVYYTLPVIFSIR